MTCAQSEYAALFERAASLIDEADGLLVTAGAGMGVDSGLPDFRGGQGFWGAYPALGRARIRFESIASPDAFIESPRLAWGFYGHRLNLYRATLPHEGFRILLDMAGRMPHGTFVFTSNVDGHFQKAGFREESVCEVHGSIHYLQCMQGCASDIWPAHGFEPHVDAAECLLESDLPVCPHCGGLARPNILMFGDGDWLAFRERLQRERMRSWLAGVMRPVVVELGAGMQIPTVRMLGESLDAPLIRINTREAQVAHRRDLSLPLGAHAALQGIEAALQHRVDQADA